MLVEFRDRCRKAVERGKQLWPAANHMEYRLALESPGEVAARMLTDVAGQFGLGPLAEVAAAGHDGRSWRRSRRVPRRRRCVSTSAWCAEKICGGGVAGARSVRAAASALRLGTALSGGRVPIARCRLLVAGGVARGRGDRGPSRRRTHRSHGRRPHPPRPGASLDGRRRRNGRRSTGRCTRGAIGAVDGPEVRLAEVDLATALAWLGWAGEWWRARASPRCRGRRLDAWMVLERTRRPRRGLATDPAELGRGATLRWFVWDAMGIGPTGWVLRARGRRPVRGVAFDPRRPSTLPR